VAGIVIAYFVDYALAGAEAWRWMLGLSVVPSLLVLVVLARLPDTPRWYVMQGRHDEARATLAVTDPEVDADAELADIEADLRSERGGAIGEMLRAPYLRATVFVVGLGFLIQITGINAVVFYSPMIFKEMGFTGNASLLLLPALVQVGSLIATLVSLSVVDRFGRRLRVARVGLRLRELPSRLRSIGASAMLTANLGANVLIALYFLSVLESLGGTATFGMFAALAAIAFAFVWWLAPETKGRPLEDIRAYWENGGRWPESRSGRRGALHAHAGARADRVALGRQAGGPKW
jgi:MFS transporter, SP family, galactose:H+ symporter